jgi:hypothetical protein
MSLIERFKFNNIIYHYFTLKTPLKNHGFCNGSNKIIGYWYQENKKGFWLREDKR